jgi:hypothetical protein
MRVNLNSEASVIRAATKPIETTKARLGQDQVALSTTDSLNRALAQTPDVRADKVAEAKKLVSDTSYPPTVIIRKISELLAIGIKSQDTTG